MDGEAHRRLQHSRLAVAAGVDLYGRCDLDLGGGPRSLGRARGWPVEDQDAEPPGVEPRTRFHGDRAIDGVGVVGDHHDRGLSMLGAAVIDDGKPRCGCARSQCLLRGAQQRLQPRVAVAVLPYGLGVEAEDDVVDEDRSVDLADVDAALEALREGLERPDDVAALHAEIAREVVSGARGNARERQVVRARGRCDGCHRAVAAGHAERIRSAVHRVGHECCEIVVGLEDDRFDAAAPARARARRPSRTAVPPPDRGLTKSTGRRGRATSSHPSATRNRSPALIAHAPVAADSGGAEPPGWAGADRRTV